MSAPAGWSSPPEPSGVAVFATTAAVHAALPDAAGLLTEPERARAAAFHRAADRDDFVAAHALVRACCAWAYGMPMSVPVVQRCPTCGGDHGHPQLPSHPEISVSWSHASGRVAAAAADGPVGIDIEPLDHAAGSGEVLDSFGTAQERTLVQIQREPDEAALLLWVRKESLVKLGLVDLDQLRTIDLSALPMHVAVGGRCTAYGDLTLLEARPADLDALACVSSRVPVRLLSLPDLIAGLP